MIIVVAGFNWLMSIDELMEKIEFILNKFQIKLK